jgi:hypothetical protein
MSAQSKGLPKSHDSALATYAVNAGSEMCRHNRVSRYGQLLLVLRNRRTMRQPERPDCADLITRIPLPSRRSSRQVGTTTRSAQSALCRRRHNADHADVVVMPMWASDPAHGGACRASQVGIIQT